MKLWQVEHFHNILVFTFGRDCYCIQQSRPKVKTNMLLKCSTCQSFIFPKWHSFKIGTLAGSSKRAPRILIFSIAMDADYTFYVKSIETHVRTFLPLNISAVSK